MPDAGSTHVDIANHIYSWNAGGSWDIPIPGLLSGLQ